MNTVVISWVISYTFHLLFRLIPLKKKTTTIIKQFETGKDFVQRWKLTNENTSENRVLDVNFFLGEKSLGVVFLTIMNVIIMFFRRRQTARQIWWT